MIDRNQVHLWKPLLHEVASGTIDAANDGLGYRAHAHNNGFIFKIGALSGIDREQKVILSRPVIDEDGDEILPERRETYDILVLAIGSVSNDFGTPGIGQYCTYLDSVQQAAQFQQRLMNALIKVNRRITQDPDCNLSIAIVGGGATGVELSAELFSAPRWFSVYGLKNVSDKNVKITLIEAGPRLLPALAERIATGVHKKLSDLGLTILANSKICRAEKQADYR